MIDQVKKIATREEARELGAHICTMILDGAKFSVLEAVNDKTKETTYRVLVEFGRLRRQCSAGGRTRPGHDRCVSLVFALKLFLLEAVNRRSKKTTYRVLVEFGRLRCIAYGHNRFKASYTDSRNHVTEIDAKTAAGALKALRVELLTVSTVYQHGAGMIK
ncbi:hypothetical protein HSE3_gp015 [Klebsiella phage vB_KleS-HSE3]|nr:hypothetical protein HSE3_gp015 [Klebsiella phage vB_KleS-HSE3]